MPVSVKLEVHGLREIEAALKELGPVAAGRVVRSALTRGTTPVVQRARELAPQAGAPDDPFATGVLKASTKRLRRQRRGSPKQTMLIGIERPVASRYAHLVEFGTAHISPEPFMRPALDERAQEVLQTMTDAMRVGIEREINKLRAKHGTGGR